MNLTFEEILRKIKGRESANQLAETLGEIAKSFGIPEVYASMLSNMKKKSKLTSRKRIVLRIMAFFIGLKRPEYDWNYSFLTELMNYSQDPEFIEPPEVGVRIDFALQSRGGIITHQMVEWLHEEIPKSVEDLKLFSIIGNKVEAKDATTATLNISAANRTANDPIDYGVQVRNAFAIAHQISVRWASADYSIQGVIVIIGIAAGKFAYAELAIQAMCETNLPGDPPVRVNELGHLAARLNDVKVLFEESAVEAQRYGGRPFRFFAAKYFWYFYYDLIPGLLENDTLPQDRTGLAKFQESLFAGVMENCREDRTSEPDFIQRLSQNKLLAIEVAKVLMLRRMFHEANRVLNLVIATDPYHLIARIFRIQILLNLGMESENEQVFNLFFRQAEEEALLVMEHCPKDEEVWAEIGLLYKGKAFFQLKLLRNGRQKSSEKARKELSKSILEDLKKAETFFQKGLSLSPNGHRCNFWLVHLKSLRRLLAGHGEFFEQNGAITDNNGICRTAMHEHMVFLGWMNPDTLGISDASLIPAYMNLLQLRIHRAFEMYAAAAQLRSFRPNVCYAIATILWDLSPVMTLGIAKRVQDWLQEAKYKASQLIESNIGVYSIVSSYSQIQDPGHFISCVDRALSKIDQIVNTNAGKKDDGEIDREVVVGVNLMYMHLDETVSKGPLLSDGRA